ACRVISTCESPCCGSVMAKLKPATRNVPSYVWLQNLAGDVQPRYLTGGFLGAPYSPLRVGTDLDNPSAPNFRFGAFDSPQDVSRERMHQRFGLLDRFQASETTAAPTALRQFQGRALDLV